MAPVGAYLFSREALMCFVPVPGKPDTYRHVLKKFIVTIPSNRKQIAALAQALNIPPKQFEKFGSGKILIVNDQGGRKPPTKKK
ncbi:hypothetical protein [Bradyrhizobium sp. STM 3843]|uniref:hypothetical protein n=1 Tax=Bradyrhizobium sp. STM 3843 TaxID=551947 RepID=UPI0011122D7A|nr:hypothetical protein [Bradyrhizobium sp. STM 3843]